MTERLGSPDLARDCRAEVYFPCLLPWKKIGSRVVAIEKGAFPENPFSREKLREDFKNPENIAVLLRNHARKIIGFAYAKPFLAMGERDILSVGRQDGGIETAYIYDVAIDPSYQRRGLVWEMMTALETILAWRYRFIEGDFAVDNGFAGRVSQWYGKKVVFEGDPHDSPWGRQIFIRARL